MALEGYTGIFEGTTQLTFSIGDPNVSTNAIILANVNGQLQVLNYNQTAQQSVYLFGATLDTCGIVNGTINNNIIGGTTPAAGTFTTLTANTSLNSSNLVATGGTINNVVIGGTTPVAGTFTTLIATGGTLNNNVIGGTTPAAGSFTTLTSNNATAIGSVNTAVVPGSNGNGGLGVSWNRSAANAEVNLYNLSNSPTEAFRFSTKTGTSTFLDVLAISGTGNLTVVGTTQTTHIIGGSGAPSIAAGTGAGTGPTISLSNAHDTSGIINVTVGTTPVADGVVVTVTFGNAYGVAPNVVISPANNASSKLSGATQVWASSGTGSFTITAGDTALTPAAVHKWYYMVMQ